MAILISCPCCGGEANHCRYDEGDIHRFWVECGECGLRTAETERPHQAIDAWNIRTEPETDIVRCHDCKYYVPAIECRFFDNAFIDEWGYCAWGERKQTDA